jgi:hypothetical protein
MLLLALKVQLNHLKFGSFNKYEINYSQVKTS